MLAEARERRTRPDWRALAVLLGLFGTAVLWSDVSLAAQCTLAPADASPDAGASVRWSARLQGIQREDRSYKWTFGDGDSSTEPNPTHVFASADDFSVTLSVTDNDGATANGSAVASIGALGECPPEPDQHGPRRRDV